MPTEMSVFALVDLPIVCEIPGDGELAVFTLHFFFLLFFCWIEITGDL